MRPPRLDHPRPPDRPLRAARRRLDGRPAARHLLAARPPLRPHAARRRWPTTRSTRSRSSTASRSSGVVLMAGAVGWAIAGRVLAPLKRITGTARRVSEERLGERIEVTGPDDELRELGETLNSMLDRLADSFDAQRRFVANASHELRSPLTVIRSEAEVALANPEPDLDELRGMAESVIHASRRTEALLASLLILARGQRGLVRAEAVDLAEAAGVALDAAEPVAASESVRLTARARAGGGPGRRGPARAPGGQPDRERRPLQPARRLRGRAHARGRRHGRAARREQRAAGRPRATPRGSRSRSSASRARRTPRRGPRPVDRARGRRGARRHARDRAARGGRPDRVGAAA